MVSVYQQLTVKHKLFVSFFVQVWPVHVIIWHTRSLFLCLYKYGQYMSSSDTHALYFFVCTSMASTCHHLTHTLFISLFVQVWPVHVIIWHTRSLFLCLYKYGQNMSATGTRSLHLLVCPCITIYTCGQVTHKLCVSLYRHHWLAHSLYLFFCVHTHHRMPPPKTTTATTLYII